MPRLRVMPRCVVLRPATFTITMGSMDRLTLCVQCGKQPIDQRWRPFCSRRCQLLDQAKWAEGTYRVPGASPTPEDPDPSEDEKV